MLHIGQRRYFTVNETGLTLLEALQAPRTFEELVEALLDAYDVDRSQAEQTSREFLDRCVEAGLLEEKA